MVMTGLAFLAAAVWLAWGWSGALAFVGALLVVAGTMAAWHNGRRTRS